VSAGAMHDGVNVIRSGYLLVAGPVNSGKSALLNALVGVNISPSHRYPGVTMTTIAGILDEGDVQICVVDTPPLENGISWMDKWKPDAYCLTLNSRKLSEQMSSLCVSRFMNEAGAAPVIVVPTFVDHFPASLHGALVNQVFTGMNCSGIVPVCPLSNQGIDKLKNVIAGSLEARSGPIFPRKCLSPHSERFLVSERIRYGLFRVLPEEIAATTAVQVEEFSIRDGKRYVRANLYVSRHSNKGVVIGKKGSMLQQISEIATKSASSLMERPLYLDLWVKVRESWPDRPTDLAEFGYIS